MYNSDYSEIDKNITDGNVGGRKKRNIRDNLFVMNAIVNSVINGNAQPIQIQVKDVEKCCDKLWLQSTLNTLFECGLENYHFNLLYIKNEIAKVANKVNN